MQLSLFQPDQITKPADKFGRQLIYNIDKLVPGQRVVLNFNKNLATVVKINRKSADVKLKSSGEIKRFRVSFLSWPTKEDLKEFKK